jgi:adenine/guanine phosphoribosyltransferase-like PRPP-binding protein
MLHFPSFTLTCVACLERKGWSPVVYSGRRSRLPMVVSVAEGKVRKMQLELTPGRMSLQKTLWVHGGGGIEPLSWWGGIHSTTHFGILQN